MNRVDFFSNMTALFQNPIVLVLGFLVAITSSNFAKAACNIDNNEFYNSFKSYREQINTASRLEDLNHFFSSNFNQYFTNKLDAADNDTLNRQYLTQYWDNLNTAKDIVIVYGSWIGYSLRNWSLSDQKTQTVQVNCHICRVSDPAQSYRFCVNKFS